MSISENSPKKPEFITLDEPLDYLGWASRNWALIKARKPDIYELKIALIDTKPAVYRTILIPGDVTLNKLHLVIQNSFNWWNYHLFQFIGRDIVKLYFEISLWKFSKESQIYS